MFWFEIFEKPKQTLRSDAAGIIPKPVNAHTSKTRPSRVFACSTSGGGRHSREVRTCSPKLTARMNFRKGRSVERRGSIKIGEFLRRTSQSIFETAWRQNMSDSRFFLAKQHSSVCLFRKSAFSCRSVECGVDTGLKTGSVGKIMRSEKLTFFG